MNSKHIGFLKAGTWDNHHAQIHWLLASRPTRTEQQRGVWSIATVAYVAGRISDESAECRWLVCSHTRAAFQLKEPVCFTGEGLYMCTRNVHGRGSCYMSCRRSSVQCSHRTCGHVTQRQKSPIHLQPSNAGPGWLCLLVWLLVCGC